MVHPSEKGGATATVVRSKSVRLGPVTGLFPVHATGPLNTTNNCLGLSQTQNTSLQKIISSRRGLMKPLLGITKGKKILNEMNTKKEEAGRVKVTAGLYVVSKKKGGGDIMKKVSIRIDFTL